MLKPVGTNGSDKLVCWYRHRTIFETIDRRDLEPLQVLGFYLITAPLLHVSAPSLMHVTSPPLNRRAHYHSNPSAHKNKAKHNAGFGSDN